MSKTILIGVVIVIIIAAALYYFFVMRQPSIEPLEQGEEGFGRQLYENPGTLVPETNPFEDVNTNPLQGINPFQGYKNPFE